MRSVVAVLLVGLVAGCGPSRPASPGSVCDGVPIDAGCGSTTPPGGTGSGPGGADGGTADVVAADGAVVDLTGRVVVATALPVPSDATGTAPGTNWRVQSLGAGGVADVTTTSDSNGDFILPGVSPANGTYLLEAVPPAGSGTLATITELSALPAHYNVNAVLESTLAAAATGAGVTLGRDLGHVVFQFVDVPSVSSGVSLQITDGTAATIAYDDVSGALSASATATGNHATIALFNIAAMAAGSTVDVRLTRGTGVATYRITVLPGRVNWVQLNAP